MWEIKLPPPQAWLASDEIFTSEEIDRIVALDLAAPIKGKVGGNGEGAYKPQQRDSAVQWVMPSPDTQWLFEIIEDAVYQVNKHFHLDLTHIHDLQMTEYDASYKGHFGAHIDEGYGVRKPHRRKLSMTVQLSEPDDYDGGELRLYPSSLVPVCVPKRRGLVTIFRSNVIHEVLPVTRGTRKSLVAWIAGPGEQR